MTAGAADITTTRASRSARGAGPLAMSLRRLKGQGVSAPEGFVAGGIFAGIKGRRGPSQQGRASDGFDLGMLVSDRPASVAAVFTTNRLAAAPVLVSRERAARGVVRGVVFNSGCANACTGPRGTADAVRMAELAAAKIGVAPEELLVASTGTIGEPLPMDRVQAGLERLELSRHGAERAARALMTTDSRPKFVAVEMTVGGRVYRIGGMAKGAGTVHPNMATMLAFVTTDASLSPGVLGPMVREIADATFNMISIDGDSSTNDSFVVLANGAAGGPALEEGSAEAAAFAEALGFVSVELCQAIACDGGGATTLVEVDVRGARSLADARLVARRVVASNLVKAALHNADPDWGRILCAVGCSGADVDPTRVALALAGQPVIQRGATVPFDHDDVRHRLAADRVRIEIDLNLGTAAARAWGCDLVQEAAHAESPTRAESPDPRPEQRARPRPRLFAAARRALSALPPCLSALRRRDVKHDPAERA